MKRTIPVALAVVSLVAARGCGFGPSSTTVRFVNNASFPVQVTMVYDSQQDVPQAILEATGHTFDVTVEPGAVATFSRACDELQAIEIEKAELSIIGDIGPSSSTRVYRDGSDFFCGSEVTFTFTQSITLTDLNISFSERS